MSSVEDFAIELLATLSNAGLKLDPLTEPKLAAIEGGSARFEILLPGRELPLPLTLRVEKACLRFSLDDACDVNAIVRGSAPDLLTWFQRGHSNNLSFDGDEQLLNNLGGLLSGYQPDLALPLSRIFGQETATTLLGFAETLVAASRSALQAVGSAAGDGARSRYTEQSKLNQAIVIVEDLNLKVDRLMARVNLLESTATHGES